MLLFPNSLLAKHETVLDFQLSLKEKEKRKSTNDFKLSILRRLSILKNDGRCLRFFRVPFNINFKNSALNKYNYIVNSKISSCYGFLNFFVSLSSSNSRVGLYVCLFFTALDQELLTVHPKAAKYTSLLHSAHFAMQLLPKQHYRSFSFITSNKRKTLA